jgi:hypothetical protein
MNPNREAGENAVKNFDVDVMAMGSMASGCQSPRVVYEYLGRFGSIRSW